MVTVNQFGVNWRTIWMRRRAAVGARASGAAVAVCDIDNGSPNAKSLLCLKMRD
jgi:hypothetical protein